MTRLLWLLALCCGLCHGQDTAEVERRLKVLSAELRCLVCQNQSLADSNADLAVDLRNQVRDQIVAGKTDAEIKDYLVQRYGDFVLYRPPVKGVTLLLWGGPFVLLLVGGSAMLIYQRRRQQRTEPPSLSEEDRLRARKLLQGDAAATEDS